jgi:ferritin-like metal-binding protein YciE
VARRAGDEQTVALAERILPEERAAASAVREQFGPAMEASPEAQGVTA